MKISDYLARGLRPFVSSVLHYFSKAPKAVANSLSFATASFYIMLEKRVHLCYNYSKGRNDAPFKLFTERNDNNENRNLMRAGGIFS